MNDKNKKTDKFNESFGRTDCSGGSNTTKHNY